MPQDSQLEKLLPDRDEDINDFNEEAEDGVWLEANYLGTNATPLDKLKLFLRIHWKSIKKPLIYSIISVILFLIFFLPIINNKSPDIAEYNDIRLSDNVLPKAYRLDLSTSLEDVSFGGVVEIDIEIKDETNNIIIHAVNLNFKDVRIIKDKKVWKVKKSKVNKENEYVQLFFKTKFQPDNYTLIINYNGILSDDMSGYYLSKYGPSSDPSFLATTQFEPTYARKAFPCFDEPSFKATFQLNMTVGPGLTALSNTNTVSIEKVKNSEKHKYVFAESTKMSTYLVAFIVSPFKSISKQNKNLDIAVYSRPDHINETNYALDVSGKVLRYYESLFDIPYPLPKLDLVAIPDFEAGAMENWGLVTFRETALLYDEESASSVNKQYVATVIAHELAHQWFGNLVTMKWWDDLWLNEGFAEFMEYLGTNAAEPEWGMENHWFYLDLIKAFKTDSSTYTHPIAAKVKNPDEISGLFDDISYSKGSSIIRMIRTWINNINSSTNTSNSKKRDTFANDYFFNRMHKYLTQYAYGNAETNQLWEALESYDKDGKPIMNISETMGTFTNQPGYPIVIMETDPILKDTIYLSQERYLANHLGMKDGEEDKLQKEAGWSIPFSYMIYSNETGIPEVIERAKSISIVKGVNATITLPSLFTNSRKPQQYNHPITDTHDHRDGEPGENVKLFLKANPTQTGFYKVQYEDESLQIMCEWLQAADDLSFISPIDRAGFIYDIVSQLLTGRTKNPEGIMECLGFLKKERSNIVWQSAIDLFKQLLKVYDIHADYSNLKFYIASLVENMADTIGWYEKTDKDEEGGNDDNDDNNGNDDNDGNDNSGDDDKDDGDDGKKGDYNDDFGRKMKEEKNTIHEDKYRKSPEVLRNKKVLPVSEKNLENKEYHHHTELNAKHNMQHKVNNWMKKRAIKISDDDKEYSPHNRSQLRASILGLACVVGVPSIKTQALAYFDQLQNQNFTAPVDQDVLGVIYSAGILYGQESEFNFVLEALKSETSTQRQDMLRDALASAVLPHLQQRLFEFAISDEVKEQDTNFLLMRIVRQGGVSAARLAWYFVKEKWDTYFTDRFPTGSAGFSRLLGTIAEYLGHSDLFNEMLQWMDNDSTSSSPNTGHDYPKEGDGVDDDDDQKKKKDDNSNDNDNDDVDVAEKDNDDDKEKNKDKKKRIIPSNAKVLVRRGIEFGQAGLAWIKHKDYGQRVSVWLEKNYVL